MTALGRTRPPSVSPVVLGLVVAVWAYALVVGFAGLPMPFDVPPTVLFVAVVALAPVLILGWALGAGRRIRGLGEAAGWTVLVWLALTAAFYLPAVPIFVLVLPAVVLAVLIARRHRTAAVIAAFALSSSFGSLTAFTPLRVGPLVDVLLLGLVLALVWRRADDPPGRRAVIWPSTLAVAGYIAIAAVGMLTSESLEFGVLSFRAAAWYLLAFLVVAYVPWQRTELDRIVRGFVVVAALGSSYAVYRWFAGPATREFELALSSASIYNFVDGRLRTFGSFTSGHELGAWAAAIVPFCTAYALSRRDHWRLVAGLASGLGLAAMLASEARIAVIAVAAGLAVVLALHQFARGLAGLRLGTTATFVGAAAIVAVVAFSTVVGGSSTRAERFANILTPDRDPAYQARVVKWETAMAKLDTQPLGHGLGTAGRVQRRSGRFVTDASVNVDNGYLKIAWEQGYVVLGLYVAALLSLLVAIARRAVMTVDGTGVGPAIGAAGTLTAYLVLLFAALYDEGLTALVVWLIVGLGAAHLLAPARRQPARSAEA